MGDIVGCGCMKATMALDIQDYEIMCLYSVMYRDIIVETWIMLIGVIKINKSNIKTT